MPLTKPQGFFSPNDKKKIRETTINNLFSLSSDAPVLYRPLRIPWDGSIEIGDVDPCAIETEWPNVPGCSSAIVYILCDYLERSESFERQKWWRQWWTKKEKDTVITLFSFKENMRVNKRATQIWWQAIIRAAEKRVSNREATVVTRKCVTEIWWRNYIVKQR